jgi:hypothetical protein
LAKILEMLADCRERICSPSGLVYVGGLCQFADTLRSLMAEFTGLDPQLAARLGNIILLDLTRREQDCEHPPASMPATPMSHGSR